MSAADPEKRSVVGKISQASASKPAKVVRSRGSPRVSVRFTEDEMVHLKRKAGNRSLATYIREATLGDEATSRPARYERKQRVPDWDHKTLAQMLGMLGKSELVRSMIALALAARALPVEPDTVEKIEMACEDIQEMRSAPRRRVSLAVCRALAE